MTRAGVILPGVGSGIHQKLKTDELSPYGDVRNIPSSTSGIGPGRVKTQRRSIAIEQVIRLRSFQLSHRTLIQF